MLDVSTLLQKYIDENIALSQPDIAASAKSREWFVDRIKNAIEKRKDEPVLYGTEPVINFGSYFKGTQVSDVDEYDILLVIDSNTGIFWDGSGATVGNGKGEASPNHKYDRVYYKSDGTGVSPSKILNWLKGVIEEVVDSFDGSAPIRNGQAVTARIESKDINIDFVPAGIFDNSNKENEVFYNIPNGKLDNGWILTNPKKDKRLMEIVSKDRENFKNVIRVIKHVRDNYHIPVTSFAIECSVIGYTMLKEKWDNDLDKDLRGSLTFFAKSIADNNIVDISVISDSSSNLLEGQNIHSKYVELIDGIVNDIDKERWEEDEDIAYANIYLALRGA